MFEKNEYLSEVHPVTKEKKTLKLMEKSLDSVTFGFEASEDEIVQFFSQTYVFGKTKVDMLRESGKMQPKCQIILLAEPTYDSEDAWYLEGNIRGFDVVGAWLSDTGKIVSNYTSDFMGYEEDLFHYFGLALYDEIKRLQPFVADVFNSAGKVRPE